MYSKKIVFAAACLGMLLFGIVMISLGTVLPSILEKFSLSKIEAGSLTSLLPLGILAGSLVFGPIVDRYGYKIPLIICSAIVMLGLEALALANNFAVIQSAIFVIGFGGGVLNGGTNALVAYISSEDKGANLSLLGVSFGIGALGMPVILGALLSHYSYENIISVIGGFILLPILYFIFISFPKPQQAERIPLKKSISLLKESTLFILGGILFFQSGLEGLVNNWTTSFLISHHNFTQEDSLFALTTFVIGLTAARLILGIILKKQNPHWVHFICIGFAVAGTFCTMLSVSYGVILIGLVLIGIGLSAGFPIILGYVGELYSALSGTAFSIVLVIALIGNVIINYFMGIIAEYYGIENITSVILMNIGLMSILMLIIKMRLSK